MITLSTISTSSRRGQQPSLGRETHLRTPDHYVQKPSPGDWLSCGGLLRSILRPCRAERLRINPQGGSHQVTRPRASVAATWIDVSLPLRHGLVPWPGDPPFQLKRESDLERGDFCTFSTLAMSAHAGTHMDAPLHFLRRGRAIDAMPVDATVGPARVIAIRNRAFIGADELAGNRIRPGERLLF